MVYILGSVSSKTQQRKKEKERDGRKEGIEGEGERMIEREEGRKKTEKSVNTEVAEQSEFRHCFKFCLLGYF